MEQFSAGVTRYTRLRGKNPDSLRDGYSAPLLPRFAIDDLKAYALEAAAAGLAISASMVPCGQFFEPIRSPDTVGATSSMKHSIDWSSAQCRIAGAADPDRRMRLLHRLSG
jgi:hypothetical protein